MNGARQYFASLEGTQKALRARPELAEDAKELLAGWLELGEEKFDLRIGTPSPELTNVTFVTPWGVVLSVRDAAQKKIAHNVTVTDPDAAAKYETAFDGVFETARRVRDVSIIDELVASGPTV